MIDATLAQIDDHLDAIRNEIRILAAARAILRGERAGKRQEAERTAAKLTARQVQALALIEAKPGITAAELSHGLGTTYGYGVVKKLHNAGEIEPCGKGWQAKS